MFLKSPTKFQPIPLYKQNNKIARNFFGFSLFLKYERIILQNYHT